MIVAERYWRRLEKRYDKNKMKLNILTQESSLQQTVDFELKNIKRVAKNVKESKRFIFSGAGDKFIVPLISKYLWDHVSKKPLDVYHSRTLADYEFKLDTGTCVVFLTQSGTTKDTLEACKLAKEKSCKIVAITNLKEKTRNQNIIKLLNDYKKGYVINTHTLLYPEEPLPSTNTFFTSLMVLNLLTLLINENTELLSFHTERIPHLVGRLSASKSVIDWAKKTASALNSKNFIYVAGDGPRYHVAEKQAKIMLMEGVKMDAAAVRFEEFVHSLIETIGYQNREIILLKPIERWGEKNYDLIKTLWERHAGKEKTIICDPFKYLGNAVKWEFSSFEGNLMSPFLYIVPLEWLAYYLALLRKIDPGVGDFVKKIRDDAQLKKLIK
jgi:glucosamine--fructose-6-phosphate aminotransferase (isomerizing)